MIYAVLFINLDQRNICFGQQQIGGGIICLEDGQSLQMKTFVFLCFSWQMLMKYFYCVNSSPITLPLDSGKYLIMKSTWGQPHNYSCHCSLPPSLDTLDHNLQAESIPKAKNYWLFSWNPRIVWVGWDLKDHLIPTPLPWAGVPSHPLDQVRASTTSVSSPFFRYFR